MYPRVIHLLFAPTRVHNLSDISIGSAVLQNSPMCPARTDTLDISRNIRRL